jgi:hypothetical protein
VRHRRPAAPQHLLEQRADDSRVNLESGSVGRAAFGGVLGGNEVPLVSRLRVNLNADGGDVAALVGRAASPNATLGQLAFAGWVFVCFGGLEPAWRTRVLIWVLLASRVIDEFFARRGPDGCK